MNVAADATAASDPRRLIPELTEEERSLVASSWLRASMPLPSIEELLLLTAAIIPDADTLGCLTGLRRLWAGWAGLDLMDSRRSHGTARYADQCRRGDTIATRPGRGGPRVAGATALRHRGGGRARRCRARRRPPRRRPRHRATGRAIYWEFTKSMSWRSREYELRLKGRISRGSSGYSLSSRSTGPGACSIGPLRMSSKRR